MTLRRHISASRSCAAVAIVLVATAAAPAPAPSPADVQPLDCGYVPPARVVAELREGARRGLVPPAVTRLRAARAVLPPPRAPRVGAGADTCLTADDIVAYEDSEELLVTFFSNAELYDLMIDAANLVIATHGDRFDFIGFWTNFEPHHPVGLAFYLPVSNDVQGIGGEIFDLHAELGLAGHEVEGMAMMWNVNADRWQPGDGPESELVRLVFAHEYEHRFGVHLPLLPDGRRLQGDGNGCGRVGHWNPRLDGQGSCMELREWVGTAPAVLEPGRVGGGTVRFNADTGGVYGYLDLYLMGYVSAEEMDAGSSELRYMDDDCASKYSGPISPLRSADLVAAVGPRVPPAGDPSYGDDPPAAPRHYRTAWVMIHQPGDPPSDGEVARALAMLEQQTTDWHEGTLRRGTMNHALARDCDCNHNGVFDPLDIAGGASSDANDNGIPDECECAADFDGTGTVDELDLQVLLAAWGTCPSPCPPSCPGDAVADCAVNLLDLLLLLASWGPCLPPPA